MIHMEAAPISGVTISNATAMSFKIEPAPVLAFGVNVSKIAINPGIPVNNAAIDNIRNSWTAVAIDHGAGMRLSNSRNRKAQTANTAGITINFRCASPIPLILSTVSENIGTPFSYSTRIRTRVEALPLAAA